MSKEKSSNDPKYDEMVVFFGNAPGIAKHFGVKVQAVYQWKDKVPATRAREFDLVKRLRKTA